MELVRGLPIILISLLVAGASAQIVPPTAGWRLNCQASTAPDMGPAFLSAQPVSNNEFNMFWSSFGRGYGGVSASGQYGSFGTSFCEGHQDNTTYPLVMENLFNWPNQIQPVPESVFATTGYFTVADGFAMASARDGCLAIVNSNGNTPAEIGDIQFLTNGCGQGNVLQTKYYYHYTQWIDMDGDGDLDLVTARASSATDPTNPTESDLLWLQNPGNAFDPTARTWKQFVISAAHNIADTSFDIMVYGPNNVTYGIAGGFASGQLILLSGSDWTKTSMVKSQTIATNTSFYFTTKFGDLNLDGIPDVIVTIGSYGVGNGKLQVYPGVDTNGVYSLGSMIEIYSQFPVFNSAALGSPGEAFVFNYSGRNVRTGVIPSILVSGDDDGNIYMFDPLSSDPTSFNWQYADPTVIFETSIFNPFVTPLNAPTVGQPLIMDVNGDGCTDVVIPAYSLQNLIFLEQRITVGCN